MLLKSECENNAETRLISCESLPVPSPSLWSTNDRLYQLIRGCVVVL